MGRNTTLSASHPFVSRNNLVELHNQAGSAWIGEAITDTATRSGKQTIKRHLFITSLHTSPDAMLRLIRQRWSIRNEWHWAQDTQLGEDAHRYANRTGAPVFIFLRSIVMNLLRRGAYCSSRQRLRELAYVIKGLLALGAVALFWKWVEYGLRRP